jgi:HEAT repeat protein
LLAGRDAVAVEAAIARLAIIGRPALRQVVQRLGETDPAQQPRLLRVLERIGDPTTLGVIRPLLTHPEPEVAVAAVDAMGALLDARDTIVAAAALDALTGTLLDPGRDDVVRVRALEAIGNVGDRSKTYVEDVLEPLRTQLRRDASAAVRAAVSSPEANPVGAAATPGEQLDSAANGDLPTAPEVLRQAVAARGAEAPLTVLHKIIERVRIREAAAAAGDVDAWRVVRATTHLALASRGSRLAVYDLRESVEALGSQTPMGMLSALQQVGDASVLEAVADAWSQSPDAWFRGQLVTIFRAIVAREKITKRNATIKKIAARLPEALGELWG